jgi:hypothetical protein
VTEGSPRAPGEGPEHTRLLVESRAELPPIVVHRRTVSPTACSIRGSGAGTPAARRAHAGPGRVERPAAEAYLNFDGCPTTIYTRSADAHVDSVRPVLAATANPESPDEVTVSKPSDALAARQATDQAFTGLLLGLGAVALLVGGIGVANTTVVPAWASGGGLAATLLIGAVAGLYPAIRASRLAPTEALATT